MNYLAGANLAATCVAMATLFVCSAGQVVHGYLRTACCRPRSRAITACYEGAALAHCLIMGVFAFASIQGASAPAIRVVDVDVPLDAVLWLNAPIACIAAYAVLASPGFRDAVLDVEAYRLMPAAEALLGCACLPTTASLLGANWAIVFFVDAAYVLARTVVSLSLDVQQRLRSMSRIAIVEALKSLPEGLMYADRDGLTLFANDAMRDALSSLGLSTDFARVDGLWSTLSAKAQSNDSAIVEVTQAQKEAGSWLYVRTGDDEVSLFTFEGDDFPREGTYPANHALGDDPARLATATRLFGSQPRYRIITYDVTRELDALAQINEANALLAERQLEITASMETLREAAEAEAMLRMHAAVHDVIGQRLSLLHRALEDGPLSDEQLERLKPLLNSILDDLTVQQDIDPAEQLAATVDAFAVMGVSIDVQGDLPHDPQRAKVFSDCIRESTTNAVKHAHSNSVSVSMSEDELSVSNDGEMPALPITLGTGLTDMRVAAESIGAELQIDAIEAPFTIRVKPVR